MKVEQFQPVSNFQAIYKYIYIHKRLNVWYGIFSVIFHLREKDKREVFFNFTWTIFIFWIIFTIIFVQHINNFIWCSFTIHRFSNEKNYFLIWNFKWMITLQESSWIQTANILLIVGLVLKGCIYFCWQGLKTNLRIGLSQNVKLALLL